MKEEVVEVHQQGPSSSKINERNTVLDSWELAYIKDDEPGKQILSRNLFTIIKNASEAEMRLLTSDFETEMMIEAGI